MEIVRSTIEEVSQWRLQAAREGGTLAEGTTPIRWYKAIDETGEFLGCVGLLHASKVKAKVRGWFTPPDHRGKGYGALLLLFIVEEARTLGYRKMECVTRHHAMCEALIPDFWMKGKGPFFDEAIQLLGDL